MPTANGRYGRPKGSGLDDRQQLESIAALLAANPKLKPTTAIRSLGVEDPSVIRRLREKFRVEQAKLMADVRRIPRSTGLRPARPLDERSATAAAVQRRSATPFPALPRLIEPRAAASPDAWLTGWCELGFSALSAAVESQTALAQQWLRIPHVSTAMSAQLALNAIAVAVYTRNVARPLFNV